VKEVKKIFNYIPEILIIVGAAVILGLIIYMDTLAGLFSLGVILMITGLLAARARG